MKRDERSAFPQFSEEMDKEQHMYLLGRGLELVWQLEGASAHQIREHLSRKKKLALSYQEFFQCPFVLFINDLVL